jgi:protoheme IX farnesyltransferase
MVLITTYVGYYLGAGSASGHSRLIAAIIGTALASGGTLALNQFIERGSDALMERTRRRPLPDGRIQPAEALVFGVALAASGLLLFAYTPMKRKSSLCGIVGAVPGALPPVIGWAAARGEIGVPALVLFAILFLWQIPHTLAIACIYREDFRRAGIRFLPIVEPDGGSTGRQIVEHCLALLAVSLLPTLIGTAGAIYFAAALVLGGGFLACGVRLALAPTSTAARQLLFASLIYLPALLVVMALDRIPPL